MSPSEASKRSSISDANDVWSPEASHHLNDGVKKFNMSYNKINDENAKVMSGTNGMTHIAQLDAVRGYVRLIDEATPPCKTKGDQPVASTVNDCCQKTSTYLGKMESSNFVRASEDIPLGKTLNQNSVVDVGFQSSPNWFKSNPMGKPYEKFEVRSGNPCSGVPSSTSLPRYFNFGYSDGRSDPDGGSTSNSPPFFEEEMDTNSVAATSAAALRKAIEEAQARIKVAKEIMEKKKNGLRNGSNSFSDNLKAEERNDGNVAYEVSRSRKKTHVLREEVDIPLHAISGVIQRNTTRPSFVAAKFEGRERALSSENGETSRNNVSSQADRKCEEAEVPVAEQFYDVENRGENWSPTIVVDVSKVSAMTSKQNVTGLGQVPKYIEAQKFVSSARKNVRETLCNNVNSTQVDHRLEKSDPAEVAEQFYEFEEVTGVQAIDENGQKEYTILIAEDVFEKPQEGWERSTVAKKDGPEEVEKRVEIQNGISRISDSSKDCSEAMIEIEVFHKEENKQKQQFYTNHKESDEIIQPFEDSDNRICSPKEFMGPLNDGKLLEIGELDDIKGTMRNLTTAGCVESETKGEEDIEKEQNHVHGLEANEKSFFDKAIKGERIKERLNRFHLGKKIAKILSHDFELEVIEKTHERDVSPKKENENREEVFGQWVDIGRISTKSDPSEGDGGKTKAAVEEPRKQGRNLETVDNDEKLVVSSDSDENLIVSEEAPLCKDSRNSITELSKSVMEANDSVEEKCVVEKTEVLRTCDSHQGLQLIKRVKPMEHETESVFMGANSTSDEGSRIGTNFGRKRWDKPACQFEIINNLREHIKKMSLKFENVEYMEKSEAAINQEDDEDIECFDEQERFIGITMEETQSSDSSEGERESIRLDEETESSTSREKDPENYEEISISQNAEANEESQKETLSIHSEDRNEVNDHLAVNENDSANESLKKEVEQERKQRRRMDEAKEREMEIEKGRIAVERAVREARERAFAEARERAAAEKAGARQRVKAETRERVGKPSGEHKPKPVTDKAREAKLKAERAAVERATAEARERALEKAMSGKTASQAKKQNPQHKGPSSTSTSRYQHSSNSGVNSAERSDGGNGESTHRSKARSERHQRISERAEKALAEKNRRDLLAQKEQAERNRLAETLDIEVKRWSSGKQGNLRALLSTLQYILGPDSGWQPIPLTDVITTAAVKKAYRKATLFVHPDKLQQRGANIQQKYTCEKVFDLLKEAWNKFNVEER